MHKKAGSAPRWPLVARNDEFREALGALNDGTQRRGVALIGASGVGKSTLARCLAHTLQSNGRTVRFVLGTQTGRTVPLGAFYRSVTVNATQEPAAMLADAHHALEQVENLVLVVDDAQLLDPMSATLVHQLAVSGRPGLIVVIRSDEAVPDAVTALWKEGLLERVHLEAFTRTQVEELARQVLGGAVDARLVDELYGRTGGNLLLLRCLLSAGRESGVLVPTERGWQLHGQLHGGEELYDLLEFRLQSLAPKELEAIEVVAVAEVLDWEILRAVCDTDALALLERRGLIQLVPDGSRLVVRLNHPVIGEAAIRHAGVVRTRQINNVLVQQLSQQIRCTALPDERDEIRLAQFMTRSDVPQDLGVIVRAAQSAVSMSNVVTGEELARFAFDRGGGLPAAVVLAEAMGWQGSGEEAEALLAAFDPDGADELLTVRWGCQRAANLFWVCGRVDEAWSALAVVKDRVDDESILGLVKAMEASFAFFSGDLLTAIATGLAVCESETLPSTMVWAAMSTAWALAVSGRFSECHRIADTGFRAAARCRSGPQRFVTGMAEIMALTAAGDLCAADRAWERYAALTAGVREAEAFVRAARGVIDLTRGELDSACEELRDAASVAISAGSPPVWLMLVSGLLAQAEAGHGDRDAASTALERSEGADGPQVAVFLPELELARAWVRASTGQTTSARLHAIRASQIARQSGMCAVEMRALHTAVRFGDRSLAARLAELARILAAPLPYAIAAHARALRDHDGHLLDEVADRFAGIGAMALAADAAAQAAREHARTGERARELASSARARWLAGQFGLHSPASAASQPLPITDREHEIATMVAAGLSNREIADRLSVSVRTVDGHLYRIFAKLGIQTRNQLARLMSMASCGAQDADYEGPARRP